VDPVWHRAVVGGDLSGARQLLAAGVDVNARDRYGQTALMLAAHRGHAALVTALIDAGAALDVTAKYGLSALMLAVVAGHEDCARVLARAGADRTLQGSGAPGFTGRTAHDLALARGLRVLARELAP
jgi:ankyrin repeat protein